MKIFDMLLMCVRNLTRRKFRTVLTIVGVIIGTCMIVIMVSLGEGMSQQLDATFNNFGDLAMIDVYAMWTSSGQELGLDDESLLEIAALDGVDAVTPFEYLNLDIIMYAGKKKRYQSYMSVCGIYPEALDKMGYTVQSGEMLKPTNGKDIGLLFGAEVAYYFEDTNKRGPDAYRWLTDAEGNPQDPFINPLEESVILELRSWDSSGKSNNVEFEAKVVGILNSGGEREWRTRNYVYMDIKDMARLQKEYNKANNIKEDKSKKVSYNNVTVKARTIDDVVAVETKIQEMGFGTYSRQSERESAMESIRRFQMIFGAIGAVSLLIATISIANTMIMSVYERTREIGVMKVLGCLVANIRAVFLIEAGLIGFFGGLTGIGISCLLSFLVNTFGNTLLGGGGIGGLLGGMMGYYMQGGATQLSIITPELASLGLLFATLIGLAAGFYPAQRAVRISALEAIKQE